VCVILFNFGEEDFEIRKGDRIAQLVIETITITEPVEVDDLDATIRGANGFGSTGYNQDMVDHSSQLTTNVSI
jgi:dUTPase